MNIFVIELNHKTATVEVREKLAFNGPKLEEGLSSMRSLPGISEAVILSTCNRVEIYTSAKDKKRGPETIKEFLSQFHGLDRAALETSLYVHSGLPAVQHIFRVACSLDSLVLGEPQILGQMKDAFEFALERKATGVLLNKLMKKAISVAKRVRTETKIAENAVSISYAAVELAKKILGELTGKSFMLLGAGEMAELAAKHLVNSGATDVVVANRTFETGCRLAEEFCGRAVKFEEFHDQLGYTDIVICSTGAPHYVLTREEMGKVMKQRRQRPVFIIDISVPRNIDPEINHIDNVYLYSVDDLQEVVDANISERRKEAEKAEEIVQEEIETFSRWQASLDSVPTIIALRNHAEDLKRQELEKLFNKVTALDEASRKAIEYMANALMNKLIHPPTAALKDDIEDRDVLIATIKRLYGLNGEEDEQR